MRLYGDLMPLSVSPCHRKKTAPDLEKSLPAAYRLFQDQDVPELVKKYELSGGNIINIVQYSCLKALEKNKSEICLDDVLLGIKREMHKEGKPFIINGKTVLPIN
jgi:hypothetical protein